MAVTLLATVLVASPDAKRRKAGFWIFLVSNVLWVAWGLGAHAYALIALQFGLAALNVRGAVKARRAAAEQGADELQGD